VDSEANFDPEVLQARWLLGGVRPEELPAQAEVALLHGYDGPALRQLSGLTCPTMRDLKTLPGRAFAEMGLRSLDKSQPLIC